MNVESPSRGSRTVGEEHVAAAIHAVRLSQLRPADLVAVVGEGPLALATVAVLLARGIRKVALLADSPACTVQAVRAGAQVFSLTASADALEQVRVELGGYGPDFVFACEANSEAHRVAIDLVRPAGMVVLLGEEENPTSMNPNLMVFADKRVQGSRRFHDEDLQMARDLIRTRRLRIHDFDDEGT